MSAINIGGGVQVFTGAGSPEGVIVAAVGSLYHRTDGGALTALYLKASGAGAIGWIPIVSSQSYKHSAQLVSVIGAVTAWMADAGNLAMVNRAPSYPRNTDSSAVDIRLNVTVNTALVDSVTYELFKGAAGTGILQVVAPGAPAIYHIGPSAVAFVAGDTYDVRVTTAGAEAFAIYASLTIDFLR